MRALGTISALIVGLAGPANAHDLWLTPGASGSVHVHFGHPDEPERPSGDKLVTLSAISASGADLLTAVPAADGKPILAAALDPGRDSLVFATYDNGYWVRLKDGTYRNASRRLVPEGEKSQWSIKFAKAVIGEGAPWDRIVGQTLEIVPLEAPSAATGSIRVRVLFEGNPLAGIQVTASDGKHADRQADLASARTDGEGVAKVPLKQAGPRILAVSRRISPSQIPALAETDSYSATFAFTIVDPKTN